MAQAGERTAGVLFMRTKGLPEGSAQIPVTLDPNLRLISDTNQFVSKIQTTHPMIGKDCMPVIGLVPFQQYFKCATHVGLGCAHF